MVTTAPGRSRVSAKAIVSKLWRGLLGAEKYVGLLGMLVMTFSVFLSVFFRYVFVSPIRGAEELARYTMVWVVFLGSAVTITMRAHLSASITEYFFSTGKSRLVIQCLRDLIGVAFCFFFLFYGWEFLIDSVKLETRTQDLDVPLWLFQGAFFVGGILFLLQYGVLFVESVVNLRKEFRGD